MLILLVMKKARNGLLIRLRIEIKKPHRLDGVGMGCGSSPPRQVFKFVDFATLLKGRGSLRAEFPKQLQGSADPMEEPRVNVL